LRLACVNQPLSVEFCPCCGIGLSRTLKPAVVSRLTDPSWATESSCGLYVSPDRPCITLAFFLRDKLILRCTLHRCRRLFLHYHSDGIDDRIPIRRSPSIRAQAVRIVAQVLREWQPARLFIGTGDPDKPHLVARLRLPNCWDQGRK